MASLISTTYPKPLAVVNYLGPATASGSFFLFKIFKLNIHSTII